MTDSIWTILSSIGTVAGVIVSIVLGIIQIRAQSRSAPPANTPPTPSPTPWPPLAGKPVNRAIPSMGAAPARSWSWKGFIASLIPGASLMVISAVVLVFSLARAPSPVLSANSTSTATTSFSPTATFAPTVLPPTATSAPPTSSGSFQDTLTANTKGWTVDAYCSFPGDGLHVNDANGSYGAYWRQAPFQAVSNATISVTARQIQGDANTSFGIVFRVVDNSHAYMFLITSGGEWAIDLLEGGQARSLTLSSWNLSGAIHTGLNAENTLSVVSNGQTFDLYINGVSVSEQSNNAYTSGDTALIVSSGGEVVYTNLSITPS